MCIRDRSKTEIDKVTGKEIKTEYIYDSMNRLIGMIDGNGKSIRIEYNAAGQQSALIDKTGNRTEYEYDVFGNLILVRYADGTTEKSTYDAEGRETSSTDRLGRTTRYEYCLLYTSKHIYC